MARRTAQFERDIHQAELDADAARYKVGRSYRQVAAQFGVSVSTAHQMVSRAIQAAAATAGEAVKAEELAKLDAMEHAAWEVLRRSHITVNNGRVIRDPRTDEPLEDDAPVLAAMDRLLKVQERRSRLLGLDAPARSTVTVITEDVIDAELRRLEAEIARSGDPGPSGETAAAQGSATP